MKIAGVNRAGGQLTEVKARERWRALSPEGREAVLSHAIGGANLRGQGSSEEVPDWLAMFVAKKDEVPVKVKKEGVRGKAQEEGVSSAPVTTVSPPPPLAPSPVDLFPSDPPADVLSSVRASRILRWLGLRIGRGRALRSSRI